MSDYFRVLGMGDVESRMQIPPIAELLAERAELVKQVAPLRARFGTFGTYDDLRKIELARIAAIHRAKAFVDGNKVTEAQIDEMAHGDDRYAKFVLEATQQRATWAILEDRIQGISDVIMRGQAIARYLTGELALQR